MFAVLNKDFEVTALYQESACTSEPLRKRAPGFFGKLQLREHCASAEERLLRSFEKICGR